SCSASTNSPPTTQHLQPIFLYLNINFPESLKNLIFPLIVLIATTAFAQPKKYQGLLWEISGNGLQKKSYVYGSMHVSEKVSYHLSDAFFTHLLASDYVATESDPSTWLELYAVFAQGRNFDTSYSGFYRHPVKREDLLSLFESSNYLMNNLMFRTNEARQDYQEETYLDLFIYQAGRKYSKKVVGLENARKSITDVLKAEPQSFNPDQEKLQAIMKLLRERSYNQAMNDFYREKNLDLLDSLYVLATPKPYFKALILDRNVTMANGIDSLARKGSLFAAVGAAHLPGKRGIIELLREKGYTVKAVNDGYSDVGRKLKSNIESHFRKADFEVVQSRDSVISVPMPGGANYFGTNTISPDLSNGAMMTVKRVALRQFLQKTDEVFDPARLDSLFYEHIPGEILSRTFSKTDEFPTYDITSKTRSGQTSRFRFYITPLEIIAVSMSGKANYIQQFEKETFPKIMFASQRNDWKRVYPFNAEFSLESPQTRIVYSKERGSEGTEVNAYDSSDNSWYFAIEKTVSDNTFIEDPDFELGRIAFEFL
ncbi:MAG: TraB/GumN family protein, partial [Proteobacteria bacterium]